MQCVKCLEQAVVYDELWLCKNHFIDFFETRIKDTISRFSLIKPNDKVAIACSGGKDSTVLLEVLSTWGYNVTALAIDEGILGYRDKSLNDLRKHCSRLGITLHISSYSKEFGTTLDSFLTKQQENRPCTTCGVWRRSLLNKAARGFDVIATGHNLDDEAQSVLMNILGGNIALLSRSGPRSGVSSDPLFTPRVKPLFFTPEKSVAAYAFLRGLSGAFTECPHASVSYRAFIRDTLNNFENKNPGSKLSLAEWSIEIKDKISMPTIDIVHCKICKEPSGSSQCRACEERLRIVIN